MALSKAEEGITTMSTGHIITALEKLIKLHQRLK